MTDINLDSDFLANSAMYSGYSLLANLNTSVGTSGDKKSYNSIKQPSKLSESEILNLYENSALIQRIIDLYPNDAYTSWVNFNLGRNGYKITKYLENLSLGIGKLSARKAFKHASKLARLFGDAYIVIGVNDGLNLSEPVNTNRIQSIEWLKVFNYNELLPDVRNNYSDYFSASNPEYYYKFNNSTIRIHSSRVLRFKGVEALTVNTLVKNNFNNISVLQSCVDSFVNLLTGLNSAADMITDYDFSILGIEGLNNYTNNAEAMNYILKKAERWKLAKSTGNLGLYDKEKEKPDQLQRRFNGAELIIDRLENYFSYNSKIPKYKLLGLSGSSGLTNSVQAAIILKTDWALALQSWMVESWKDNIYTLLSYVLKASDTPNINEKNIDENTVQFPLYLPLTDLEKMELEKMSTVKNKILFDCGVITVEEWRQQYSNSTYTTVINLIQQN